VDLSRKLPSYRDIAHTKLCKVTEGSRRHVDVVLLVATWTQVHHLQINGLAVVRDSNSSVADWVFVGIGTLVAPVKNTISPCQDEKSKNALKAIKQVEIYSTDHIIILVR